MYQRATCLKCLLGSGATEPVLRNISVVVTRNNATATVVQAVSEDWNNAKPYEDIPGPKPLPLIGNVLRFIPHIGDLRMPFSDLPEYFQRKYGKIAKLAGLPGRLEMVFLFDPNEIEKVFRNEGPWPMRDILDSMTYYRNVTRKEIFQGVGGTLVTQGEEWHKFRSKVNPIMMQPRATKLYTAPIDDVANDFIKRIRILRNEKQEMPEDFENEFKKWALESIVFIALDKRLGCLNEELHPDSEPQKMINAVNEIFDNAYKLDIKLSFWKFVSTPAWRDFVKAFDYFAEVSIKYINEAKERLKDLPKDSDRELTVLEKLLARDTDSRTAMVMALDMMGAGIDTTSYVAATALYFLAKNPEKQQKLIDELQRHLPDKDQPITADILNELKYLKACLKESKRIKPIFVHNTRTLGKDMVLSDYKIPKGTQIVMPSHYLSNQEKYFPQADKYIPERWLKIKGEDAIDTKMTHPFVYMPFGFGPRMCVGRRFAELELETIVTKIVRNFHVEYNYGEMDFEFRLLHVPSLPLKFKFVDRP